MTTMWEEILEEIQKIIDGIPEKDRDQAVNFIAGQLVLKYFSEDGRLRKIMPAVPVE